MRVVSLTTEYPRDTEKSFITVLSVCQPTVPAFNGVIRADKIYYML